ncbi:hypothetical protein Hypma_015649 [Hypsizygus marmoreus]|uniref:Uncharacterized protein n=1 Tax=Hypsizygus marmoreus TaxID=39966 RepID=A0A369K6E0_HYPMA|nr:hypothetical protein Hypma_015649 [Hypsizygus marmoreus]
MYRVQKHFYPITSRSLFSPERELTPPPTTLRTSFPLSVEVLLECGPDTGECLASSRPVLVRIPKPTGSYELKSATKWNNETFSRVQAQINHLVDEHLDTTVNFSQQPQDKLRIVHSIALDQCQELESFQGNWVTTELIKLELRRTVQNFSRKRTRTRKPQNDENPTGDVQVLGNSASPSASSCL